MHVPQAAERDEISRFCGAKLHEAADRRCRGIPGTKAVDWHQVPSAPGIHDLVGLTPKNGRFRIYYDEDTPATLEHNDSVTGQRSEFYTRDVAEAKALAEYLNQIGFRVG